MGTSGCPVRSKSYKCPCYAARIGSLTPVTRETLLRSILEPQLFLALNLNHLRVVHDNFNRAVTDTVYSLRDSAQQFRRNLLNVMEARSAISSVAHALSPSSRR